MKLADLVKDIRKMSEAELREHVRRIRHSKYVEKPALAARKEKPKRQEGRRAASKVDKLTRSMSDADREQLIKLLEKE